MSHVLHFPMWVIRQPNGRVLPETVNRRREAAIRAHLAHGATDTRAEWRARWKEAYAQGYRCERASLAVPAA